MLAEALVDCLRYAPFRLDYFGARRIARSPEDRQRRSRRRTSKWSPKQGSRNSTASSGQQCSRRVLADNHRRTDSLSDRAPFAKDGYNCVSITVAAVIQHFRKTAPGRPDIALGLTTRCWNHVNTLYQTGGELWILRCNYDVYSKSLELIGNHLDNRQMPPAAPQFPGNQCSSCNIHWLTVDIEAQLNALPGPNPSVRPTNT
jgi:hypothetical protein